jgi:hypothetical protein
MNYQDEADEILQSVLLHKNLFIDREAILKEIAIKLEAAFNKGYDAGRDRILNLSVQELEKLQNKMLKNLADPEVAKRVDAAEEKLEEDMKKAASEILQDVNEEDYDNGW